MDNTQELSGEAEHDRDSQGAPDMRRCARHPEVVIGSPCGQFDAVCGKCEQQAEDDFMWDSGFEAE